MGKEKQMLEIKKQMVSDRIKKVENACDSIISRNIDLTYKVISEETGIPCKTLERSPYKDIISAFRNNCSKQIGNNIEFESIRTQNKHLKDIIKQLIKENNNLKTELLNGKI